MISRQPANEFRLSFFYFIAQNMTHLITVSIFILNRFSLRCSPTRKTFESPHVLINYLKNTIEKTDIEITIRKAAKKYYIKLKKYYNKMNKIYTTATVLNPRFKIQYYKINNWKELIDGINTE